MAPRTLRADARRNYDLLVAAARDAIFEYGPDAPLDDIARRAGVGNATLYRHFPTRDTLLVAVYSAEVDALTDAARRLLETSKNGQALKAWMRLFIEHLTARRGLASASLNTAGESKNLICHWHDPLVATTAELLADAREHGAARPDMKPMELLMMANTIAAVAELTPDAGERLLDIAFDGITPR
ncbi:TetR/AcrR family transcriptional regulator [Streptomyces fuscichromogenes]|uniref:TetR family transcriptional regulator n=1 Tax=Streptomyces fuscichromogenes TaxID=1324013 RepID=A0A917XGC7_9ACTN|nr:TetR/AcrR family transcriptional regulator [Streptomyces fuscichromogenes]GGN23174.1 TetR family transcriptional regulator [Streptomyces fuscichromogenes]